MNGDIIVTIGIAVKNADYTINKAIESILIQDYPVNKMELIIVDGHSNDKTINIIKKHLNNSILKYSLYFENTGLAYARQIIVNNSKGKYIVWVDGDMILSSNFITKLVKYMEQNPKVGIAKGQYGIYNTTNLVSLLEDVEFVLEYNAEGQTNKHVLATSGSIYRVEAIKEIDGFDIDIKGVGEDLDAEYRIKERGWSTHIVSAIFYEQRRTTWKALWDEYFWHGKGGFYLFRKNRRLYPLRKMFFPLLLLDSFVRVPKAYRLLHKKEMLLLPFHYVYKRIAWLLGFLLAYE